MTVIIYETFEKVKAFEQGQAEEMDINTKLAVLDQIYRVYDDFTGKLKVVDTSLIANRPIKVLMIPPEHRHAVTEVLSPILNYTYFKGLT